MFLSCVIGIVVIAATGINQYCTSFVTLTIFALTTGSLLLPILIFAFLASNFNKDAAYGLHDLANLCRNLIERRHCACISWDPSQSEALAQRQEQRAHHHAEVLRRRSLNSELSADSSRLEDGDLVLPVAAAFDLSDVATSMSNSSTPVKQASFSVSAHSHSVFSLAVASHSAFSKTADRTERSWKAAFCH